MLELYRTDAENPDFVQLVKLLDADLKIRDGKDHAFYAQYNKIDRIKYAIVAYWEGQAVGCGAIKHFDAKRMEVKRMYVREGYRGQGFASQILSALEAWASELQFQSCVLETGINQPEAISLYKKRGYTIIDNYGQYEGVKTSFCFSKALHG
ncbi:MAG: GNAT family N-acetyltransferase [Bacteroidota bacterium]